MTTAKLGPLAEMLQERFLAVFPELKAGTGTHGPRRNSLEIELAAHGDGAYYRPHIDLSVGPGRKRQGTDPRADRVLSAVYYFHAEPKAFSGGELRLYRFGPTPVIQEPQPEAHFVIEPVRNSLVAFPSWVPHEVRPVSCPSGNFRDYRFTVNCWYCRG